MMSTEETDAWYKALKGHGDCAWPITVVGYDRDYAEREMVSVVKQLADNGWIIRGASQTHEITLEGRRAWKRYYHASKDAPKPAQIYPPGDYDIDF